MGPGTEAPWHSEQSTSSGPAGCRPAALTTAAGVLFSPRAISNRVFHSAHSGEGMKPRSSHREQCIGGLSLKGTGLIRQLRRTDFQSVRSVRSGWKPDLQLGTRCRYTRHTAAHDLELDGPTCAAVLAAQVEVGNHALFTPPAHFEGRLLAQAHGTAFAAVHVLRERGHGNGPSSLVCRGAD